MGCLVHYGMHDALMDGASWDAWYIYLDVQLAKHLLDNSMCSAKTVLALALPFLSAENPPI